MFALISDPSYNPAVYKYDDIFKNLSAMANFHYLALKARSMLLLSVFYDDFDCPFRACNLLHFEHI